MLNFNSVLVFSDDPDRLAEFYKKVFDKEPIMTEGGYTAFQVGSGVITFGPHDKVHGKSANPERIMLNLESADVRGEFARIKALGATVIAEPYEMELESAQNGMGAIATFADPDGNYFQVMAPFEI